MFQVLEISQQVVRAAPGNPSHGADILPSPTDACLSRFHLLGVPVAGAALFVDQPALFL